MKIDTNEEYLFQNTKATKFHEMTFIAVLTPNGDVINRKLTRQRAQTRISCTNGHRKIKSNSKRNYEVRYSFMKLFSQNLEILAPCRDVIIAKLSQKESNLYIM